MGQAKTARRRSRFKCNKLISSGPGFAAWGRVAQERFDGAAADTGSLRLDGEVMTGTLGAGAEWDRLLAGVAVSLSEGQGDVRRLECHNRREGARLQRDDHGEPQCAVERHRAGFGLGPRALQLRRHDDPVRRRRGVHDSRLHDTP